MNVRPLQTRDLFTVVRIIRGCAPAVREAMRDAVTRTDVVVDGQPATQIAIDRQALGFVIFEAIVDQEKDVVGLLADLAGMKPEKFLESGAETVLDVVDGILDGDDLKRFLSRALALASRAQSAI